MKEVKEDNRFDDIRIRECDVKASSVDEMANWLLSVLSNGNIGAYAADVVRRADAAPAATA